LIFENIQACKLNSSNKSVKVGVAIDVIQCILKMKGPYTTGRRVYTSFSSHCRPKISMVQEAMKSLETSNLGKFKEHNKLKVFYKNMPTSEDLQAKLVPFSITLEDYIENFSKEDDGYTVNQRRIIVDGHPNTDEFDAYNEREILPQLTARESFMKDFGGIVEQF
jgi:hypothetical protein